MKRTLLAVAAVAAAVTVTASGSGRPLQGGVPRVCEGLPICTPIAGPWVVVPGPARGETMGAAEWQLSCVRGIVGGLMAHVSQSWIDVSFSGRLGSPVNPGITTGPDVVFTAVSVGPHGASASFLPLVGCIPSPGGERVPSSARAPLPGEPPLVHQVRVLSVWPGHPAQTTFACGRSERLLSLRTTIGLYTARAPTAAQRRSIRVTSRAQGRSTLVTAVRHGLARDVAAEVQLHALCASLTP